MKKIEKNKSGMVSAQIRQRTNNRFPIALKNQHSLGQSVEIVDISKNGLGIFDTTKSLVIGKTEVIQISTNENQMTEIEVVPVWQEEDSAGNRRMGLKIIQPSADWEEFINSIEISIEAEF